MDQYIVSARKYRPSTFKSVVGQRSLTTTLKNAIDTNRLAQAYLFCGPRGVGKTSCARIFAKTINCMSPTEDGEACNECESCRAFNEGRSYNVVELDAASNNSVDDIRALNEQVRIPPQIGRYRVFIIDEVHMLSVSAFNAFLKTLEEPPKYVVFILATTEKHKVIPTILSRCQIYDFNRMTINDMVEHLQYVATQEGIEAESSALNVIAQKADGAMRDALSIFDQVAASSMNKITYQSTIENLNVLDYDYYFRLIEAFRTGNVVESLLIYKDVRDHGFNSQFFINGLGNHIRDLMVAKDSRTLPLLEVGKEVAARYLEQSKPIEPKWFYTAMDLCNSCDLNYRTSTNKQFLVELTLIKLCQLCDNQTIVAESQPKLSAPSQPNAGGLVDKQPNQQTPNTAVSKQQPVRESTKEIVAELMHTNHSAVHIEIPKSQPTANKAIQRRPPTYRISDVMTDTASAKTSAHNSSMQRAEFSREQLVDYWAQYIANNPEKHILINAMRNAYPEKISDETYRIIVDNPAQKQAFENSESELIAYLRKGVGNDMLAIEVEVSKLDDKPKMLSSVELLQKLVDENPAAAKMLLAFDAELM